MPTGIYLRKPQPRKDPLLRFWKYVARTHDDDDLCWPWTAGTTEQGYGAFWVDGKTVPAHRFIFQMTHPTPLRTTEFVCHRCDNPPCVRRSHLFLGTSTDNIHDAINKGRFDPYRIARTPSPRGEKNARHKLTEDQVREIRTLYQQGQAGKRSAVSLRGLARKYAVSKFAIQYVLREGWKHVTCHSS